MDPLRDRIFGLLSDLCGQQHEVSPDSLRLLSHTLLGVARDHAPTALFAVRDALPFVTALVEASDGADAEVIAELLVHRGVVSALTRRAIIRRIDTARSPRPALGSTVPTSVDSRISTALRDIALLNTRMMDVSIRSEQALRDDLLSDPELFAAAVDLCLDAEHNQTAARFEQALSLPIDPVASDALATLSELENCWDGGALRTNSGFEDRTIRFALSAADHLRQAGFLPAVRAALAFGPSTASYRTQVAPTSFAQFGTFQSDRSLDELAAALAAVRGKVLAYLQGRAPLSGLEPWTAYLRGSCSDLAEARDISLREATSFAHFCLHLMNFCDLTTIEGADDDLRAAMMSVEDELKEFALNAQREALEDAQIDLVAYDDARWSDSTIHERVAERLARLSGGWRTGFEGTCPGRQSRLNPRALAPWKRTLSEWDADGEIARLFDGRWMELSFENVEALSSLSPQQVFAVVAVAMNVANESTSAVCFEDLAAWLARDADLARATLDVLAPTRMVTRDESSVTHGVTAVVSDGIVRVTTRHNPEFEALALLSRNPETPLELRTLAQRRMKGIMGEEQRDRAERADRRDVGQSLAGI